jgi:hypothetical protein
MSEPALDEAKPEVVTLCGSTRFQTEFERVNREMTMQGKIVISLGVFGHLEMPDYNWDDSDLKQMLDTLHKRKIDIADRVHIINPDLYLGVSTRCEIRYAYAVGKRVTFEYLISCGESFVGMLMPVKGDDETTAKIEQWHTDWLERLADLEPAETARP